MAMDSARSNRPPSARHMWQVPAFLLGVAALVAVLVARPHFAKDTVAGAEHQLHDARKALEQSPPDLAAAVQKADRTLAQADRYPQLAGEAHFLAGSAHLRMGDEPIAADAAARERQQARQHLDLAVTLGVSESDQPKLNYRLAKASLLLGGDPAKAAALLEKSAEVDDAAEGYGLLTLAYTRITPPDLAKAEPAAKQALDRALRTSDARLQAIARFRLGELDMQLKKTKEARQMLARVGREAPPELFFAARTMAAESFEESHDWNNAVTNWQVARENPKLAGPEKAKILYHLGICFAADQRKEAGGAFEETVALGGPEGQAAGLRLAECRLEADPAGAVAALTGALQSVHAADDYRNPLISVEDVRALVEKAAQVAREKADWPLAQKVVEQYARVAVAGKDDELAGQIYESQGMSLIEAAKKDAANQTAMDEQAHDAFRQAAAAYERAAGKTADPAIQGARLWRAADLALSAGQSVRARDVLVKATELEGALTPEKKAEAWLRIGNTDQRNQRAADARIAYQKCLSLPGPYALRARLGLAKIELSENHFDDADRGLQDVLKQVREGDLKDTDLHEQALFVWAELAYLRQAMIKEDLREYGTAEERLRGAIEQYPDGLAAVGARITLGKCYWNDARAKSQALEKSRVGAVALSEEERAKYARQLADSLRQSAEEYEKVEEMMLARERANGRLTKDEADYLKKAAFWGADCYFWLQKYDESVRRFGTLAIRYQGRPEEMIALSQIWQSYSYLGKPDKMATLITRMQESLVKIPDDAFDGRLETHNRDYWVKWLKEATKPAVPPAPPRASAGK